jgi:hypothetical protein
MCFICKMEQDERRAYLASDHEGDFINLHTDDATEEAEWLARWMEAKARIAADSPSTSNS